MARSRRIPRNAIALRTAPAPVSLPHALPHESRGQGIGSPWQEDDLEAAHFQKRLCVNCGRFVRQLQDERCLGCLYQDAEEAKDSRVRYFSPAIGTYVTTGALTRGTAESIARQFHGEVLQVR